jgi:hypothetical protein
MFTELYMIHWNISEFLHFQVWLCHQYCKSSASLFGFWILLFIMLLTYNGLITI